MANKKKKYALDDEDILTKVQNAVASATNWTDSRLARERERVQSYYDGTLPARQSVGSSSYVSSDVYDSIESMKAQVLEVFGGGHDILRFKARNEAEVPARRVETSYIAHQIYDKNNGFQVFHDVLDDGLKSRIGVVQAYWEHEVAKDEHTFKKMPIADVEALLAQDDIELNAEMDEGADQMSPTYSGYWCRVIDKSRFVFEPVPGEEYFSEGSKKRRQDGVRGRRVIKTMADLINDGYDRKKVEQIGGDDSDLSFNIEALNRNEQLSTFGQSNNETQPEMRQVTLYEVYAPLVLNGDGKSALYRIVYAGKVMFEIDEVDEDNFVVFTPLRRPHSQHGNNFGKRLMQTQNARTVLTRAILDHTATTVNPRWQVLNGALTNPRELLDNRLRGIVNTKVRDGIMPLQYPNLNPFVYQTLEMLKMNKEENTGLSSLSQGLNKDAISTQNSQGLVENLVTLSQVRQKIIARNFAAFLTDLYRIARKLVIENEKHERVFKFDNEFNTVDPKTWDAEAEVEVSLHLGYGEQEKEAAKFAQLWGFLTQDPNASKFCSPEKQYKLLTDGMRKNGFVNVNDYTVTPDKVPQPQPDQLEMAKIEVAKMSAQASLIQAQAAAKKVEVNAEFEAMKVQIAEMLAHVKAETAQRDADRKDLDVAFKSNVAERELDLAQKAPDQKGIFSANS